MTGTQDADVQKGTRDEDENQQPCDTEADGLGAWKGVGEEKKQKQQALKSHRHSFRRLKP